MSMYGSQSEQVSSRCGRTQVRYRLSNVAASVQLPVEHANQLPGFGAHLFDVPCNLTT